MKTSIGIDIGSVNMKVVKLSAGPNGVQLDGWGIIKHRGDNEKIKAFIKNAKLKGDIRVNFEDPQLKIRRLDLPPMPPEELEEAVKWGLKDIIEGDVDDYLFRYADISSEVTADSGKKPLVVFAAPKKVIDDRRVFLKELGLGKVAVIEPDATALSNAFNNSYPPPRNEVSVILDLGFKMSIFVVMGSNGILFSRPITGYSAANLLDLIVRNIGCDKQTAAKIFEAYFSVGYDDEKLKENLKMSEVLYGILKSTVAQFFSAMALETQRSIDRFSVMNDRKKVAKIYLAGGGSHFSGFSKYLGETLGVEVLAFDPFAGIAIDEAAKARLEPQRTMLGVAVGLALD